MLEVVEADAADPGLAEQGVEVPCEGGPFDRGAVEVSSTEYRWIACRLPEAPTDALRVADSRSRRIPDPDEAADDA
ncbi:MULTISPECIES: hypothetical protein [unclassified Streptomyces]|uniref:hypothetical protein n=1 Tax=unclassified Streptomyces TaxID=2593676 RepID=UPI0037FA71D0